MVGTLAAPDTVVCLVEVECILIEITAGIHGVVDHIAVVDGDFVEFNQVLFRLKRQKPDPNLAWK